MNERRVINALDQNSIHYDRILHSQTFSSMRTAQATHIKAIEFAKPVIINVDGKTVMAVLPASYRLSLKKVKESMGAQSVEILCEEELRNLFPDSSIGAMPPMGNLYGMDVIMDQDMEKDENISFNCCNHEEVFKIKFADYKRMVHPRFVNIHKLAA